MCWQIHRSTIRAVKVCETRIGCRVWLTGDLDFKLHIYDTTSPPLMNGDNVTTDPTADHPTTMKVMKSVNGVGGGWTIADSHLSPDNERMIYSALVRCHLSSRLTLSSLTLILLNQDTQIHMLKTRDPMSEQVSLEMADTNRGSRRYGFGNGDFRLFACRFSADGNEIVSGGTGQLFGQSMAVVAVFSVLMLISNTCSVRSAGNEADYEDSGTRRRRQQLLLGRLGQRQCSHQRI